MRWTRISNTWSCEKGKVVKDNKGGYVVYAPLSQVNRETFMTLAGAKRAVEQA